MPVPLYLPGVPDPVFALYHAASGPQLDTAVLLCPPFGWEDMCSYRCRREWAQQLSANGHHTLRIDLPGSGDSGGSPRDPDRLAAWTAAIEIAALWLRARPGIGRVAAIGIGLGGLLALEAARSGAAIDELVLWAVPARGRRLVREMRAFSQMESSQLDGAVAGIDKLQGQAEHSLVDEDGSLAVAGYVLTRETVDALEALDFGADDLEISLARVLLLERDGRAADASLRAALEQSGATVASAQGTGYARMMMAEPQDAVPAVSVFAEVGAWLAHGADSTTHVAENSERDGEHALSPPPAAKTIAPSLGGESEALIAGREGIELTLADGARVRETPFGLEHPFGDPVGVLTEPLDAETAGLCAVWLNAGPQRRTGPNRMWVELARRWAARGVPSLRLDLAGIGDAGGDARPLVDARSFFVPDYLEQVRLALDALQARGLPPRFLLGGLCSGGYWAFQTALDDERAVSALMLNPGVLVYDGGVAHALLSAQELGRNLLKLPNWRRALRGEISLKAHRRTARVLAANLPVQSWRAISRTAQRRRDSEGADEIDEAFDRLDANGARAIMIFAGEEHVHIDLERHGHLARMERWPAISVEHIAVPLNLHTLRPLWLQRTVHELLDRALRDELTRLEAQQHA